jgi:hypothetical protein
MGQMRIAVFKKRMFLQRKENRVQTITIAVKMKRFHTMTKTKTDSATSQTTAQQLSARPTPFHNLRNPSTKSYARRTSLRIMRFWPQSKPSILSKVKATD